MKSYHPDISLRAGDDWAISGELLTAGGDPLDLQAATIEWRLLGADGKPVISASPLPICWP